MTKVLIYDSGIGGRAVHQLLSKHFTSQIDSHHIQLDYFGDTENFPYGTKSEEELKIIVEKNLAKFAEEDYDVIGVACNTASLVIDSGSCRDVQLNVPTMCTIIEPTIAKIQEVQPSSIFIIGTEFTVSKKVYSSLISEWSSTVEVIEQAEQELVGFVEEKNFPHIQKNIERIISQIDNGQTLLLGCTHFSVVRELFEWEIEKQGKDIQIIDPAEELGKEIIKRVEEKLTS